MEQERVYHIPGGGSIQLLGMFGDELTIVNSARVSFGVQKEELGKSDIRLLEYLYKNKHMSPFRHVMFRFRINAPEFVMRQMYKHVVGIETTSTHPTQLHSWNEISGRYKEINDFYEPIEWRKQSEDNKQGSYGEINQPKKATLLYNDIMNDIQKAYYRLLLLGVCKEQARIILPLTFMTQTVWTCSLQAVMNFIELRDHEHAQKEIREYAGIFKTIMKEKMPILFDIWFKQQGK